MFGAAPHVVRLVTSDHVRDLLLGALGRGEQRHVALVRELQVREVRPRERPELRCLERPEIREDHRDRTVEPGVPRGPVQGRHVPVDRGELEVQPVGPARQRRPILERLARRRDVGRGPPPGPMRRVQRVQRAVAGQQPCGVARRPPVGGLDEVRVVVESERVAELLPVRGFVVELEVHDRAAGRAEERRDLGDRPREPFGRRSQVPRMRVGQGRIRPSVAGRTPGRVEGEDGRVARPQPCRDAAIAPLVGDERSGPVDALEAGRRDRLEGAVQVALGERSPGEVDGTRHRLVPVPWDVDADALEPEIPHLAQPVGPGPLRHAEVVELAGEAVPVRGRTDRRGGDHASMMHLASGAPGREGVPRAGGGYTSPMPALICISRRRSPAPSADAGACLQRVAR